MNYEQLVGTLNGKIVASEHAAFIMMNCYEVPCCGSSRRIDIGLVVSSMMTSSNENIFRVTGHLRGEFICHRRIPPTHTHKASDAELWCFLWSAPEQTTDQTIETPVIWDAVALIMTSLWWHRVAMSVMRSLDNVFLWALVISGNTYAGDIPCFAIQNLIMLLVLSTKCL